MSDLFIKIFNLSVTAGWLVLAVLLCRPLMKKAPKWINCLLWGIVGLRLVFPFSLESIFSLVPSAEPIPEDIMFSPTPEINSGIGAVNSVINPIISTNLTPGIGTSVNPMQLVVAIASVVWVIGIALMLGYEIVSYISLRFKVRASVRGEKNVYFCDEVDSPFILGVIRPRIYVPSGMSGEALEHVLAHERAHLRRGDHFWKPIGFAILAFYWFNPLLWVAYVLLCRDIESACDEKVIKTMDTAAKKSYSEVLLSCSLHRKRIMACPLAFGEVGVKERIKSVLNYKKPAFWVIIVALIATLIVSVCFLTNPKRNVLDVLEPGTDWISYDDAVIAFYVDENGAIEGTLAIDGQSYKIVAGYRKAGISGNAVFTISRSKYDPELSIDRTLFRGIISARGDELVYEINYDGMGLLDDTIVFRKADQTESKAIYAIDPPSGSNYEKTYIYICDYGCESENISIEPKQIKRDGDGIVLTLEWSNERDNNYNLGKPFKIFRYTDNDEPEELSYICAGSDPNNPVYPVWEAVGYVVWKKSKSGMDYNITDYYDISLPGKYRFESYGAWIDFEVIHVGYKDAEIDKTMLFDISGGGKYDQGYIYVSNFGFKDSTADIAFIDAARTENDIVFKLEWHNRSLTKQPIGYHFEVYRYENGKYVALEHISAWKEAVICVSPLKQTSPTYNITQHYDISLPGKYRFECYGAWVEFEVLNLGNSTRIYDTVLFDIDCDDEPLPELCTAYYGFTSGLFTFSVSVTEMGFPKPDYFTTYQSEWMDISFVKLDDGKLRLQGVTQDGRVRLFDIALRDGNVILSENGEELSFYGMKNN